MKLALTIDGRADTIEILAPAPACRFQLGDAAPRDANVESPEPGVYSVLLDGRSYDAFVEDTPTGLVVTIEGHRFEVEVRDPRRWSRKIGGRRRGHGAIDPQSDARQGGARAGRPRGRGGRRARASWWWKR